MKSITFILLEPGHKSKIMFAADKWVVLKLLHPTQRTQTKNIKYVSWKNVIITFAALSMQADKYKKEK